MKLNKQTNQRIPKNQNVESKYCMNPMNGGFIPMNDRAKLNHKELIPFPFMGSHLIHGNRTNQRIPRSTFGFGLAYPFVDITVAVDALHMTMAHFHILLGSQHLGSSGGIAYNNGSGLPTPLVNITDAVDKFPNYVLGPILSRVMITARNR